MICTYGVWAGYHIIMNLVEKERLMEMTFYNSAGEKFMADIWVVFSYLQQENGSFIGVVLLCIVVAFMLWLFFGYHMDLVRQGYSTNESSKKSEL